MASDNLQLKASIAFKNKSATFFKEIAKNFSG
jgi:hypothetical protein